MLFNLGDVPPLQNSKFRGVLTVGNVEPPGVVAINTCHKNIFCPEICPEIQEAPGAAAIKPATHQILRRENLLQFWRWTLLNLKHDAFTTSAGQRKSDSKVEPAFAGLPQSCWERCPGRGCRLVRGTRPWGNTQSAQLRYQILIYR
jgi:hypothetical protein